MQIPLPLLPTQRKIAEVLDKADAIRKSSQKILAKYVQLAQSVFMEMFGDHKFDGSSIIDSYSEIISGVTKNSKLKGDDLIEVPYMCVANVQDGFLDLSVIKFIKVNERNIQKYQSKYGDVLLTEGGDPDKIGRGTIWKNEIPNFIHQNHIFGVRLNASILSPFYVSTHLGIGYGKRYFLNQQNKLLELHLS